MVIETAATTVVARSGLAVTEAEYERIALADQDVQWEMHRGRLREKPLMSVEHDDLIAELAYEIRGQVDRRDFRVRANSARLRGPDGRTSVPDLLVVPTALDLALRQTPGTFDLLADPVALVVEVWSPSTGGYDVDTKIPVYQARGDLEIWRIHPYQRTLTIWRKQDNGSHAMEIVTGGIVAGASLPGVTLDLDALFDQ